MKPHQYKKASRRAAKHKAMEARKPAKIAKSVSNSGGIFKTTKQPYKRSTESKVACRRGADGRTEYQWSHDRWIRKIILRVREPEDGMISVLQRLNLAQDGKDREGKVQASVDSQKREIYNSSNTINEAAAKFQSNGDVEMAE